MKRRQTDSEGQQRRDSYVRKAREKGKGSNAVESDTTYCYSLEGEVKGGRTPRERRRRMQSKINVYTKTWQHEYKEDWRRGETEHKSGK